MARHYPDLEAEQAYVDFAYACLDTARERAAAAVDSLRLDQGGTRQARVEFDTMLDVALTRLTRLAIGDRSLVFGRIDLSGSGGRFYIGRVGLWDNESNTVLVDWRAPVAELFYRATGVHPMGLERRRRFASRGRTVFGFEDEVFGERAHIGFGLGNKDGNKDNAGDEDSSIKRVSSEEDSGQGGDEDGSNVTGGRLHRSGVLTAVIEAPRTGRLSNVVATIQAEQDEVIRSELPGVLVVQGGPGTGKTVVALHRAAYLLYTHRFPLESQGVLVIGPNRLFLAYIEQVLPSLGEVGVELAVLDDMIRPLVRVARLDSEDTARVKGDSRMVRLIRRAVRDRQRPLRRELVVGYGLQKLRLSVDRSAQIVIDARRRYRQHNAGRLWVERAFFDALADNATYKTDPTRIREFTADCLEVREALEWMWPVLTPAHLLNDLFGSKALLRSAASGRFDSDEIDLLYRPRDCHPTDVKWSFQDVPLLDEALVVLGHRPKRKEEDSIPTYGHIVVDEAQDLSPMQLRMISRRSLNGSLTVVGDIAQATGAWAHDDWDSVLKPLHPCRQHRYTELTIGYRIPAPAMALANRVLFRAASGVTPPMALRTEGDEPRFVACNRCRSDSESADSVTDNSATDLVTTLASVMAAELVEVGKGNVAVIVPASLYTDVRIGLTEQGVEVAVPSRHALDSQVALVPVRLMKGLEADATIVVEPGRIVAEERFGLRSLYVALTRATKRVTVVHAEPLPDVLAPT